MISIIHDIKYAPELHQVLLVAFKWRKYSIPSEYKIRAYIKSKEYFVFAHRNALLREVEEYQKKSISGILVFCVNTKLISHVGVLIWEQGKGIGSKLISHIVDNYGEEELYLTVAEDNLGARRIYEKFGFKKTGRLEMRRPGNEKN